MMALRRAALGCALALALASSLANADRAAAAGGTTVYLPNITKMLGGDDGWQTPFIVQNVGTASTDVRMDFYSFAGDFVKTRVVQGLAPGTSVFHDPNHDPELAPGGQFSVVVTSTSSPIVAVVNEHQNVSNQAKQEALSYSGISRGSTNIFLPYVAYTVNGWLTTMIIQNLGAATANVSAKFMSFDGTKTVTLTRTVAVGRSRFVDPRVEPTLVAGTEYGVSISSDQPIGVVVNAHNDLPGAVAPMGFSYNGVIPTEDTDTFVPYAVRNADGISRSTRLIIQNIGLVPKPASLFFRRFGEMTATRVDSPSLLPGASWSYDLRTSTLPEGEYGVHLNGGQLAVVSATTSPATAMGFTNYSGNSTLFYLPNITRTLGGTDGWTTPIIIQPVSTAATTARLLWYRFADGTLVTTQTLSGLTYGSSVRVDPRTVAGLEDNTQYAVVVELPAGGAAAIVTELNFQGGDGAMAYEGFEPAPIAPFGTTNCSPSTAPAGSTFICRFYGLPPGSTPITFTRTIPTGPLTPSTFTDPVSADGSWTLYITTQTVGQQTVSAAAGGKTATTSFTVTIADFTLAITTTKNGQVSAQTKPGLPCTVSARLSDGSFSALPQLQVTQTADAAGNVSWTYPPISSPGGSATYSLRCTSGHQTLFVSAQFSVP